MPTANEIRLEWKTIRSALGNLICYIDGKEQQLGEREESWSRGYDCGFQDGLKAGIDKGSLDVKDRVETAYDNGLEDGWRVACKIRNQYTIGEMQDLFGMDYHCIFDLEPHFVLEKIKEYESYVIKAAKSNAAKFEEVFGFMPGYEVMDDGRSYFPCFDGGFWTAEYKEPEAEA